MKKLGKDVLWLTLTVLILVVANEFLGFEHVATGVLAVLIVDFMVKDKK